MIRFEISNRSIDENKYHYMVIYGIGNTNFPIDRRGVHIVGRENNSCDSLVEHIARDVRKERYEIIMGSGMQRGDKKRIENYMSNCLKKR